MATALALNLTARLDAGALVDTFGATLGSRAASLGAIVVPDTADRVGAIGSAAGGFDAHGLAPTITALVAQGRGALGAIVPPGDPFGRLGAALALVEQLTAGDLRAELDALVAQLDAELGGGREGGLFGVLLRLSALLAGSPQGGTLAALLQSLLGAGGLTPPPAVRELSGLLPALDALVRAVGGLMMLETVLGESQRLTGLMAQRLDARALARELDTLMALFEPALAARIAAADPADDPALQALLDTLSVGADRLGELREALAVGMGQGEATLAYLGVDQVQAEVTGAAALLRQIDLEPLERQLRAGLGGLASFTTLDFASLPAQSFDTLLGAAEAQLATVAGQLASWDPTTLTAPLERGLETLTAPLADLTGLVASSLVTIRSALDAVRRVITDLPIGTLADAVQALVAPIADALQRIAALVADVGAALQTAAETVIGALGEVEGVVDDFKAELQALFGQARAYVDSLNLESLAGQLADGVQQFTQAVEQAQMKPVFDTAVDAIGTAADVVGAVPFGLLPEDMKSEVDAAVAPIKAVDLGAVETQVEGLLGITADGRFAPREELQAAIGTIQAKFDELVQTLRDHDPQQYLAQLDERLGELAARIGTIAPAVTLQPVQDVIDDVKAAIAGFDLQAQLAPLQQVFDDAIAALEPYSPARLIEPLETRVTAARTRLVELLKLDSWSAALDEIQQRAASLLALIDPAQLEPKLAELLGQSRALTLALPDANPLWLGTVVAALHRGAPARIHPAAYPVVQQWIDNRQGAAELTARSAAIADAVVRTHAAVQAVDIGAWAGQLAARIAPIRAALIAKLPAVPDASPAKAPLARLLLRLDAQALLGPLAAPRARYLAKLEAALPLGQTLARTGLSEVDTTLAKLQRTFEPVRTLLGTLRAFLRAAGVPAVDQGVPRMLRALFEVAPPERLAALAAPIFVALRGRVQALIDGVVLPLKAAIARLQALIAAIDLAPLREAVDEVFQQTLGELQALSPQALLAAPLGQVQALKAEVAAFDPLGALLDVLDALRDTAARLVGKLSAQQLLADPIAIYREIVDALDALNVQALMAPVLDLLDAIAHDVDQGLDDTVAAFRRLQDALPSGGGGSSVSVDVGVSL